LHLRRGPWAAACAAFAALGLGTTTVHAHGFEGDRFFPPTIQTDDPFATDEFTFPTVTINPSSTDSPSVHETDAGFEFDKEIFPKFAVGISDNAQHLTSAGTSAITGFDVVELSAKYQVFEIPKHEFIVSAGVLWDVGGTGSVKTGAPASSVFTPTIYFGKGLGDLPDELDYLKPFAVTGTFGEEFPTGGQPKNLDWGLAVEYSLPYLMTEVKDIGLPRPFRDMIPLVEFSWQTPPYRNAGPAIGTINPGVLYESTYYQLGVEAIIPFNSASGHGVGAVFQVQIFLDDIFPKLFGHPSFGSE
jgi:hypothetical protein